LDDVFEIEKSMQTKRTFIVMGVAALVLGATILWMPLGESLTEAPTYLGKNVNEWLREAGSSTNGAASGLIRSHPGQNTNILYPPTRGVGASGKPVANPTLEAIRYLGDDAVPWLEAMRAPDTLRDKWYGPNLKNLPASIQRILPDPSLPTEELRQRSAEALAELGKEGASAKPVLLAALSSEDAAYRKRAAYALSGIVHDDPGGGPISDAAKLASGVLPPKFQSRRSPPSDGDPSTLALAGKALPSDFTDAMIGIESEAPNRLDRVIRALSSPYTPVRMLAANRLYHCGRDSPQDALKALLPMLTDPVPVAAYYAKRVFEWLRPRDHLTDEDFDAFLATVADDSSAPFLMAQSDRVTAGSIQVLRRALADGADAQRSQALSLLRRHPDHAGTVVPELANTLVHAGKFFRASAADALGSAGPAASTAIVLLEGCLHDDEEIVRVAATNALARIRSERLP
jgi:HEAT repeat protein